MRRVGSRSLGEFPFDVVRVDCERCGRAGRYALARLIERFGADAAMPDVLMDLAACERRKSFSQPCGARSRTWPGPKVVAEKRLPGAPESSMN
jgi:hypothetical protein